MKTIKFKKQRINLIKAISLEEKQYIIVFYDSNSKQFGTSTTFDISNAIFNLLERKQNNRTMV